jgi:hypothetical protein
MSQADRKFFIEITKNYRFEVTIVAGSKTKKKKGKTKKKK